MLRFATPSEHGRCTQSASTGCHSSGACTKRQFMRVPTMQEQMVLSRAVSMAPKASSSDADTLNDADSSSQVLQLLAAESGSPTAGFDAATARRRRDPKAAARALTSVYNRDSTRHHKRADYAPGARVGGSVEVQLARQLRDLMKNPIPGISVAPDENDIMVWQVLLAGPEGSPYAGGWFEAALYFSDDFPGRQPDVWFKTTVWHPNINEYSGRACVALGESKRLEVPGHRKVQSAACVLVALQMLLSTPNPDNVLNRDAALQMRFDKAGFEAKARAWTRLHAIK